MVKFLDTIEITAALQRILKRAEEKIILVSPYIDIGERYKSLIQERNEDKIPVTIVWGKKKKQLKFDSKIKDWINSMEFVEEIFYQDLHAKCYLNEKEAVVTSMNLYEASKKNVEMGILLTKEGNGEAYEDLLKEVNRLIKRNTKKVPLIKKSVPDKKPSSYKKSVVAREGFCIRCKEPIKLDSNHPYCKKHYDSWKVYKDKEYKEKKGVCHICGKDNSSSLEKPVCLSCYNKNKELFKKKTRFFYRKK